MAAGRLRDPLLGGRRGLLDPVHPRRPAQVVTDIAYTLQATNGVVPPGNWIDPVYLVSAALLGAVLWAPSAAGIHPSERLDSLTSLGNRGGMQVDLEGLTARASEQAPVALYIFDLNGFKRYNDTFGHPAGDILLAQLGGALRSAVGQDGTAYRIGGDEFCVLLTCAEERFDGVTRKAVKALTARGKGYDVSASWGAAVIPREATAVSEALQLADVRMYAQKESRRLAHHDEEGAEAVKVTEWPEPTSGAK